MEKETIRRTIVKHWILASILTLVLVALLLLWLWGGVEWVQGIYLWIAGQENALRGIDGITEASRVMVMGDAARHFAIYDKVCLAVALVALLLICLDGRRRLNRMEH